MKPPKADRRLLIALLVIFGLGAALPAHALYDKMYRFHNTTGRDDVRVRVFTNTMEVVTDQYTGWRNPWGEGTPSYVLSGGIYTTRIAYKNPQTFDWSLAVKVGWTTSDHSCRLRDLRWAYPEGGTDPILDPEDIGGVPGGGELVQNPDGSYTWWICNDTGLPLQLHGLQVSVFEQRLTLDDLEEVLEVGIAAKRVADIDDLIDALKAEVRAAKKARRISPITWTRLLHRLNWAVRCKELGLNFYEAPQFNLDRALRLWGEAIAHMQAFIATCREGDEHLDRRGARRPARPVPPDLAEAWIADAEGIIALLQVLPAEQEPPVVPDRAQATPANAVVELPAGQCFPINLQDLVPGNAILLTGDVIDGAGNILLGWAEQVTVSDDLDPPGRVFATVDPEPEWTGWITSAPVAVTLDCGDANAGWYCGFVGEDGEIAGLDGSPFTETAYWSVPLNLNFPDEGVYGLVYMARDQSGNCSAPGLLDLRIFEPIPLTIDPIANCHEYWWSQGLLPSEVESKGIRLDLAPGTYLATVTGGAMSLWATDEQNEGLSWLWGPARMFAYNMAAQEYYEVARFGLDYEYYPTHDAAAQAALGQSTEFDLPTGGPIWIVVADENVSDNRGMMYGRIERIEPAAQPGG